MPISRAVVLTIDRLGAAWMGPYGNTWLETPSFNRLAAESLLVETAMADSPSLETWCRSIWRGQHALAKDDAQVSLADLAIRGGGRSLLLTDERQLAEHPLAATFTELRWLEAPSITKPAEHLEDTELFRFFAAAQEAIQDFAGPGLLWLHSRGMSGAWDAPPDLRQQFADELDPDPPSLVEPPNGPLAENHDPDELLGFVQSYAGQVALADLCLAPLLEALQAHPLAGETLFLFTSPRGYPLGEHRYVGPGNDSLYGELLHVPLLIRSPDCEAARVQRIVQPHQLFDVLADSTAALDRLSVPSGADIAYSTGKGERAIRTAAWFLRQSDRGGSTSYELFAKPDDRWEANEVSSLCADVVALLAAELDRFSTQAASGNNEPPALLAPALCDIWR